MAHMRQLRHRAFGGHSDALQSSSAPLQMQIDVLEVDGKIYGFSGMYRPFVRQSAVYSKRAPVCPVARLSAVQSASRLLQGAIATRLFSGSGGKRFGAV